MSREASVRLADARPEALSEIARLAEGRNVDAVLLAGDTFDRNEVENALLHKTVKAMGAYAGPWILLPGNHDYYCPTGALDRLKEVAGDYSVDLRVVSEPEPIELNEGKLVILPAPLLRRHVAEDLTEWFDTAETDDGVVRVGLAHGGIREILPEDYVPNNPISKGRAITAKLDYLALGDWHGPMEVDSRTYYSGTPETNRFRSKDPGRVLQIRIAGPGKIPEVTPHAIGRYTWRQEVFDLHGEEDIESMRSQLASNSGPGTEVLELTLEGALDLAGRDRLDKVLDGIRADRCEVRLKDKVTASPSDDELESFAGEGFVREAMQDLLAHRESGGDDIATVEMAMQLIFNAHKEVAQ